MPKPAITLVIAAISPNPAKPPSYFAGWSRDHDACRSCWTAQAAQALRFTDVEEASVEAALLAPGWRSRLIQPLPVLHAH